MINLILDWLLGPRNIIVSGVSAKRVTQKTFRTFESAEKFYYKNLGKYDDLVLGLLTHKNEKVYVDIIKVGL